jgi:16S rRNA (guanine(966)-N(2))-methyltransferase RsmD
MSRAPGTLRIIAGSLKGRRLGVPAGDAVRPTSDRLRETLFNVLGPTLDEARVLDGFAGTGALGLEALSRGAAQVTFIERDPAIVRVLASNIETCGVSAACRVVRADVLAARLDAGSFDLALLDPPYALADLAAPLAHIAALMRPSGRVVLEHDRKRESPARVASLVRTRVLLSGDSALSFFAVDATSAGSLP